MPSRKKPTHSKKVVPKKKSNKGNRHASSLKGIKKIVKHASLHEESSHSRRMARKARRDKRAARRTDDNDDSWLYHGDVVPYQDKNRGLSKLRFTNMEAALKVAKKLDREKENAAKEIDVVLNPSKRKHRHKKKYNRKEIGRLVIKEQPIVAHHDSDDGRSSGWSTASDSDTESTNSSSSSSSSSPASSSSDSSSTGTSSGTSSSSSSSEHSDNSDNDTFTSVLRN